MSLSRLLRPSLLSRQPVLLRTFITTQSRLSEQPTVLSSLQMELKAAMRAKDKPRLTALRAILAEITNASKTAKPIASDGSLLSLLLKQIKASQTAVEEFKKAKREDLVEKEQGQINILEEYANKIPKVSEEELDAMVKEAVARLADPKLSTTAKFGTVMGNVRGNLGQRPVDTDTLNAKIKAAVGAES